MSAAAYALPVRPHISGHASRLLGRIGWCADHGSKDEGHAWQQPADREFTYADALAASGDYFVTLATRLDKLAQGMQQDSSEQIELEYQVKTLFYMQEHYDLVAKYKRR